MSRMMGPFRLTRQYLRVRSNATVTLQGCFALTTLNRMPRCSPASVMILGLVLVCTAIPASGQRLAKSAPVILTVVDENGLAVADAQVTVTEPGYAPTQTHTDYAGRCNYHLRQDAPYQLRIDKPGFYQSLNREISAQEQSVQVTLAHEQVIRQEVTVVASPVGIDTEQSSNKMTLSMPEIVNVPYPTSRDIRNLLPFNPGVVADLSGQVHVAGSETYATLDLLDGFDIRSPVSGMLALRVSADAVRSIETETTRYPVQFGKTTGGVIALYTGMGDNKFRLNATNFFPSFRDLNGVRFDKFVPRITFSGPIVRNRAWFFNGLETEYDDIYIEELPANADTNHLLRGSNLIKAQVNLTPANILTAGLLFDDYHSPYDGISSLTPQQSTTKRDTIAWLPYVRDQYSLHNGTLLDIGAAVLRFRDGYEPHGDISYEITPELPSGSYFENLTGRSQRVEGSAALYLPPRDWAGRHDLKVGLDLDSIRFDEDVTRAPVSYLREDRTLLRRSVFPQIAPFTRHNFEIGAYAQDHWLALPGLVVDPGLRFDWDEIIRRPLISSRLAVTYSPPGGNGTTKLVAGIGLYYGHTQLEYLTRALAGIRYDTYYAADGVTPVSGPLETNFTANYGSLREAYAVNWSVGLERKLPGAVYASANFLKKRTFDAFGYVNQEGAGALSGNYLLTNPRQDHYYSAEFDARHTFTGGYTLFLSYTHSSARTNAALDYVPTVSQLGPQQSGPLAWDTPNRVISWGWLPLVVPKFPQIRKRWDFVYTLDWHTGFPFTSVDDNYQVVGSAGSARFPDYVSFSPGLEWRFHFRGKYFGLRGVLENATDSENPVIVNNVVDSPEYRTFSEFQGRAFTARIRLIGAK
jgi:hypothetical protein